ncbi:MFS transporter [Kitasatospora sp. NBC_01287]|uniref:MFS transporter n=1 Tax=Kitasatospora sp. NBC_01287 TaxID=2903573 RepID=UPI00225594D1|nr:MFS transporter [Kitasatospora sp. NBC_01287]MCX4744039.1 MFS transporter [Kitasatospora sp. NBC_01287]
MADLIEGAAHPATRPGPPPTRGRWGQLSLLGGAMLVDGTEAGLVTGLFPVIRQALGLTLGALGILTAAGKLVGVLSAPLWVWAARRWSRKGVLVLSTGLWGVWGLAAGFSRNFAELLLFVTVLAAGYAAAQPLVSEIVADLFDAPSRGRAVSALYGGLALAASVLGPLIGQLAGVPDGWRWGLWGIGLLNLLFGLALLLFFRDPGRGAAERQLADLDRSAREARGAIDRAAVLSLFRIPSFVILLVSRLLSGHLLLSSFAVVYLVDVFGFSTQRATVVLLPLGVGYLLGTVAGGFLADWADRRSPRHGLPAVLQGAQVLFALLAVLGTQVHYRGIGPYALLFCLMGAAQGVNPGINRPMVMAVVPPELRAAAFTVYVSIFEAIAWAAFSLGAGFLGDAIGLRPVFLAVLVVLMLVNGAFLTLLHRPYAKDVARVQQELDRRRRAALA